MQEALGARIVPILQLPFSCNFFRGKFDEEYYFNMVESYFLAMEKMERAGQKEVVGKKKK